MSPFFHTEYFTPANLKMAIQYASLHGLKATIYKSADVISGNRRYMQWVDQNRLSLADLEAQKKTTFPLMPTISITVPLYKTKEMFLRQMLDSVVRQTYSNWELCLADSTDSDGYAYIRDTVAAYQRRWPNIRYCTLSDSPYPCDQSTADEEDRIKKNARRNAHGISATTNKALTLSTGDFIAFMDHDDLLEPDALFEIVAAINRDSSIDVLYTDEDKTTDLADELFDPYLKPDFDLDLLRSSNYITHLFVVRSDLLKKAGLFNDQLNGSQDYDFILRTCELAQKIHHIPKVLYHWRVSATSVAGDPEQKTYAYDAAVRALQNHLDRCHVQASVSKDLHFGYYKIRYALPDPLPVISICMSHCADDLADRIRATCAWPLSHLEFVSSPAKATGQVTVMLYHVNDIWESDWLDKLCANVLRPEIGIAAGRSFVRRSALPFKNRDQQKPDRPAKAASISLTDRMLQDNGLILTSNGQLHSPFFGYQADSPGYCYHAVSQRFVSFVSPYCYAVKTKELVRYMQQNKEKLQGAPNRPWELVLGFCMETKKQGRSVTALPSVSALCDIDNDRSKHLSPARLPQGITDPYYNPNFSEAKMYQLPL